MSRTNATSLTLAGEIAIFDLRQGMRNYKRIFVGTAAALFLIGFLAFGFKSLFDSGIVVDPFTIGVVNQEKSGYMAFVFEQVQKDEELSRYVSFLFFADEKAAEQALDRDSAVVSIEIPDNFLQNLLSGRRAILKIYASGNKPVQTYIMTEIINSYFNMFVSSNYTMTVARKYYQQTAKSSLDLNKKTALFITDSMNLMKRVRHESIKAKSLRDSDTAGLAKYFQAAEEKTGIPGQALQIASVTEYYFVAVVLLFILFISVAQAGVMISEQKNGLAARIILSGAGKKSYFLGKFAGGFFLTFGQSAILLAFALLFFYQNNARALPMILLVFCAVVFMVNALSYMLAIMFENLERFTLIGNLLVFTMAAIGGGLIPILYLPDSIYFFAWLTPHYWGIEGIVNAIAGRNAVVTVDVLVLLGLSLIYAGIAGTIVRRRWSRLR